MRIPQRWPLSSREYYENVGDMWDDVNLDSLVQPLLVDTIENAPHCVRLTADGMHLIVEPLNEADEHITLYALPVHVRERLIDRIRFAALVYQHPFTVKQDGTIFASYKGSSYDIMINYTTRFYGRDEILTFQAHKADNEP